MRKFTEEELTQDEVVALLKAGLMSPTSKRSNSWQFIAVDDKLLLEKLSRCKPSGAAFVKDAALAIVVTADPMASDVWIEDASVAAIMIQLQAEDLGLGSCWVQVRERDTADGAGWGHGMQCLIWGYPIDGTLNALNILNMLKGSPWEKKLSRENVAALLNYFRGGNFYYYKGYNLPCVDRYSMAYKPEKSAIRYQSMLKQLLTGWRESFTEEELTEMERLYEETTRMEINMDGVKDYSGTRWFFNNDDLVKKNDRYHIIVNMASVRCDGLESAHTFADAYNYYVTDGGTLFQRNGNEYRKAFGAYDVTAYPGVTAREGMDRLRPVTNWRGYCSKFNFAAAATSGGENAAAGYIFEKMNASEKENVNDKGNSIRKDSVLYGVKAYKSYFIIGDYLVALGAGITNLTPEVPGRIRTSVEQVERTDSVFWYKGENTDWLVQQGQFAYSVFPEYKKRTFGLTTANIPWTIRTDMPFIAAKDCRRKNIHLKCCVMIPPSRPCNPKIKKSLVPYSMTQTFR